MSSKHFAFLLFTLILGGSCAVLAPAPLRSPPPAPTPTVTPWPLPYRFAAPEYGANLHIWWDRWAAQRDWRLVHYANLTWVKHGLAWHDVRPHPDAGYDWSRADIILDEAEQWDVNLVFRLDRPPAWAVPAETGRYPVDLKAFGAFCYAVAARYRGRVRGYQVWNEPNLAREWNDAPPHPADYTALLRECFVQIKRADPQALVISAGLAPTGSSLPVAVPDMEFLAGMYEAGAAPYFDLLGLHAPGYAAPPEVSPQEAAATPAYGGQRFFCFRHVEDMRALMKTYGDTDKQVAILEFGWTTDSVHPDYQWFAVTPEQQADYLVRALEYAHAHWSPWIGPMFVWNIPDPHWTPEDEEFWWAIADPFHWKDGQPRPAYEALKEHLTP